MDRTDEILNAIGTLGGRMDRIERRMDGIEGRMDRQEGILIAMARTLLSAPEIRALGIKPAAAPGPSENSGPTSAIAAKPGE